MTVQAARLEDAYLQPLSRSSAPCMVQMRRGALYGPARGALCGYPRTIAAYIPRTR
jgi:hypothetical protein